jgi:CO/xanthine dehydrogenase Mo-binding subunit
MTELLQKEFSRKTFVKGGGALIVGFSLAGVGAKAAKAADSPFVSNGPYDMYQIDAWIVINADNTASIKSGAVSQGTGSITGILMIAAEELDLDMSQMRHVPSDTNVTPMTGVKAADNTIILAGRGVRAAAASARLALLDLASARLGVPASSLSVSKGVVSGGGKSVTYGDLLGGKLFNIRMPASYNMTPTNSGVFGFFGGIDAGQSPAKPVSQYKVVGTSPPQVEIPAMVTGTTTFVHNIRVPGMLHGRVVRPRGQMLFGFGAPIVSVDESSISHLPGARVVRKGDFLGVVAPQEYHAIQAAAQLKVKWADPPKALSGNGNEFAGMRALDSAGKTVQSFLANTGDVNGALASAAHVVAQSYGWPTNCHTPIGPNCAVADVTSNGARIFAGTQGVYKTRDLVAPLLGLPLNKVRVSTHPYSGAYGYPQYQEAACAAALMSQLAGAPVRLQLMRWDEIGWDQTAPGTLFDIRAGIDSKGNLVAFDVAQFYPQYRDETVQTTAELAGTPLIPSRIAGAYGPVSSFYDGQSTHMYNVPNNRHLLKSIPLRNNWIKADWMRSGSAPHGAFAGEQVIDELARAAGIDPVAFRVQNVTQGAMREPLLAVLNAVAKAANWQPKVAGSKLSESTVVSGRGVAWSNVQTTGHPTATIADVEVNKKTGKVTVKHIYQAVSPGLSVYPGGVANQIDAGVVQTTSRVLTEELRYSKTNVTSADFISYPILRFKDTPNVTSIVIQRLDTQPEGVGNPVTNTAPAAIANAFFDATGVRMRTAPLTPARVRAALKAAAAA